jgi:hypothetical protein
MLNNRKIQILGATVLIVAAVLVTLSAVKAPAQAFISVTGSNPEGLAQYQPSERSAYVSNPNDLVKYYQNGLVKYNQTERNLIDPSDSQFNLQQGHWFGK